MQNKPNETASFSKVLFWPSAAKGKQEVIFDSLDVLKAIENLFNQLIGPYQGYPIK